MSFTTLKPGRFWRRLKQTPEEMREESQIGGWEVQCYSQGKRDEVINDFKKLKLRNWIQLVKDRKAWNDLVQKTKTI